MANYYKKDEIRPDKGVFFKATGDGTTGDPYVLEVDANVSGVTVETGDIAVSAFSDSGDVDKKALVDGDRHAQVDVLSSALPSGAATSAKQDTIIGHVDGLEALLATIDADTSTLAADPPTATNQSALNVLAGAVDESAPASDTANSGLNGRLQRIAQRVTSLIALLPASIGQKNKAGSLAVTLASDEDAINIGDISGTVALPTDAATETKQDTGNTSLASIDTKTPALGQALAAASVPVILPSATITALTPPAAITGFATETKQDTIIGHIDGLETLLTSLVALFSPAVATTATLSNVSSSASNGTLLAENTDRIGVLVANDSTATLYLKYGATASTSSYTVKMEPGSYWEMPQPIYQGIIDGIWSAANGAARITELE